MPKTGLDMTEGEIVSWRKNEGDPVQAGEVLLEIMTDKTSMELEAEASGVLLKITHQAGETVPRSLTRQVRRYPSPKLLVTSVKLAKALRPSAPRMRSYLKSRKVLSTKVLRFLWYISKALTTSASSVVALLAT